MQDLVAGRYRLDARVGTGGMAEVWRATDTVSGSTVALKRIHPSLAVDPAARARFRREVELAREISHPALMTVLDADPAAAAPWLTMPFASGGTLAERLRTGALPEEAVAAIGSSLAGGLAALHAGGLVHRDVTTANVLLDGDRGAMLGDFGIVRRAGAPVVEDVTLTGDLVGTLRFLAPEVLHGEPATPASDVWALGAVLYEALAGRPPFDASTPAALLDSQRTPPVALPARDLVIVDLVGRMLDPDPDVRPAASDVARVLSGAAPLADPADDVTRVIPAIVAGPSIAPAAAAVPMPGPALARPLAAPAPAPPLAPAVGPAPAPAARPRRSRVVPLVLAGCLGVGLAIAAFASSTGPGSPGATPATVDGADRTTVEPSTTSPVPTATPEPAPTERPAVGRPSKDPKPGKGNGGGKGKGNGN